MGDKGKVEGQCGRANSPQIMEFQKEEKENEGKQIIT
jgi:hypothetical protein